MELMVRYRRNLTYSSMHPTQANDPLDCSLKCISTARTYLQLHCELSTKSMARADHFWRMYIDWWVSAHPRDQSLRAIHDEHALAMTTVTLTRLLSCQFLRFLALLCAAISKPSQQQDTNLISDVVASPDVAAERAPSAGKLYNILRKFYQIVPRSIDEGRRINSLQTSTNPIQLDPNSEKRTHRLPQPFTADSLQQRLRAAKSQQPIRLRRRHDCIHG